MSKIAEKKVRELGYGKDPLYRNEYSANDVFEAAIECYDQATQDFMEKACEWILYHFTDSRFYNTHTDEEIKEQFKNYMQDEM